jgi:multidrug efflux pump
VLGAVPLALAAGAGAESRQDIGWVIVGGLLVGTLFTLFVIPVVYTYLSRRAFIESDETAPGPEGGHGKEGAAASHPVPAAE